MKKIINRLIDDAVVGADKYINNGSTWLIFTETKQWVIELTKEKTLWYNYNFFKNLFAYMDFDVVENQHYITQWVEETIINKVEHIDYSNYSLSSSVKDAIQNGVKDTSRIDSRPVSKVEDTIKNGVKETKLVANLFRLDVEDTIKNGVKETNPTNFASVEDTIENGVKETLHYDHHCLREVVGTIQNGIKEVTGGKTERLTMVNDTIKSGVKQTMRMGYGMEKSVEDAIQNGVKETELHKGVRPSAVEDTIENGIKEVYNCVVFPGNKVENAIQNGIKETKSPGADGDLLSTLEWMKSNNTVNIPELIDDVIDNGVKYTGGIGNPNWMGNKVENVIENGVKDTKKIEHDRTTYHAHFNQKEGTHTPLDMVQDVIQNGVKHTHSDIVSQEYDWSDYFDVKKVIENGVKETHVDYYHHKNRVEGVIKNGIQETKRMDEIGKTYHIVNKVIVNGVKEVKPAYKMIYNPMNFERVITEEKRIPDVTDVIRDGIKEVQPLPAQDGNRDWGVYYYRKGEPTKPHTKYVDEVIENGIKEN
jgi:hypothetical protein